MKTSSTLQLISRCLSMGLIFAVFIFGCSDNGSSGEASNENPTIVEGTDGTIGELPQGSVDFTHSPITLSSVAAYEPMGDLRVLGSNHGGILHKDLGKSESAIQVFFSSRWLYHICF